MSELTVPCPECAAECSLASNTESGEIVVCGDCGVELEVMAVDGDKVTVEVAPEADEDWGE